MLLEGIFFSSPSCLNILLSATWGLFSLWSMHKAPINSDFQGGVEENIPQKFNFYNFRSIHWIDGL